MRGHPVGSAPARGRGVGARRLPARSVRAGALGAVLVATLALGGCGGDGDSIAGQAQRGDNKGYVAGSGAIEAVPPDRRAGPVTLEGPLLDGTPWRLSDVAGKVVVVNVWGSWCAPCEAEMPLLQRAWTTLGARHPDLRFVGLNVGESAETGAAAAKRYGQSYPSVSDPDRALTLGLQGKASATPTTLVLDRSGRIAARISGEVSSEATLTGLVEDVMKEG